MLYVFIGLGGLVLVGFAVFAIRLYLVALTDKRIAAFQNDLVVKHYNEVQHIYDQMRGWRHDYHNHIQTMKAFLALGQDTEHTQYLNKLDADLTSVDTMLKTGNVMVDAILNSKISIAKDISINAKATVPQELVISEIDLCIIIGNLLDNAIEACLKLPNPKARFIRVYVGRHKSMLYISVTNAIDSRPKKRGQGYLSTKKSPSHGFGLSRIDRIAAKYGGFVNRQTEEGAFATEITLPL